MLNTKRGFIKGIEPAIMYIWCRRHAFTTRVVNSGARALTETLHGM